MPIAEIAVLPADQLALLQGETEAALQAARTAADWLAGALALRYSERARALRNDSGKDSGTVRFEDGPVTVTADLPKKVDWDQAILAGPIDRICLHLAWERGSSRRSPSNSTRASRPPSARAASGPRY
jgi:hypothetical protein